MFFDQFVYSIVVVKAAPIILKLLVTNRYKDVKRFGLDMRESRAEREVHKRMHTTPSIDSASDPHHNDGQSLVAALSLSFSLRDKEIRPPETRRCQARTKFTLPDTFGALPVPRSRRDEWLSRLHTLDGVWCDTPVYPPNMRLHT